MKLSFFIAKKIKDSPRGSFSRIATNMVSISVSVAIIILILAFAILRGFKKEIKNKLVNFDSHLKIERIEDLKYEIPLAYGDETYSVIRDFDQVKSIFGYANILGILQTNNQLEGVLIRGVGKEFHWSRIEKHYLKSGRVPDADSNSHVCVSKYLANRLGLKVGERALFNVTENNRVRHKWLKVVGIYETSIEDIDKKMIMSNLSFVQKMFRWDSTQVEGFGVNLVNYDSLSIYTNRIDQAIDYNTVVEDLESNYFALFGWLDIISSNMNFLIVIISIVVFINVLSVTAVIVMEKTSFIGVMRALGASWADVQETFLLLLVRIYLRSIFIGNLIALSIGLIQEKFQLLPMDPENYYIDFIPVSLNLHEVILINIVSIIGLFLMTLIPIILVSRIKITKAIRFS